MRLHPALLNGLWFLLTATLAANALRTALRDHEATALLYAALHAVTAILFLLRRDPRPMPGVLGGQTVAVASLLSVYLYRFDREGPLVWMGDALLFNGALLCLAATASLGRSFGVLPACRGVQTAGLYRFVRHPIYSSYVLMDIGAVLISPSLWNLTVWAAAASLLVLRMRSEEELLEADTDYAAYRKRVRFRLLPYCY